MASEYVGVVLVVIVQAMAFHGCDKAAAAGHYRRYAALMREAGKGEKIPARAGGANVRALKGRMTRSVR